MSKENETLTHITITTHTHTCIYHTHTLCTHTLKHVHILTQACSHTHKGPQCCQLQHLPHHPTTRNNKGPHRKLAQPGRETTSLSVLQETWEQSWLLRSGQTGLWRGELSLIQKDESVLNLSGNSLQASPGLPPGHSLRRHSLWV